MKLRDEWGNLWAHAEYGMRAPAILVQITPFSWGIGVTREWKHHHRRLGCQLGPISLAVEFTGLGRWQRCWPGHLRNEQIWKDGTWQ